MHTWRDKYNDPFTAQFECEQDYIDAMFVFIVMQNYGVWIRTERLYVNT